MPDDPNVIRRTRRYAAVTLLLAVLAAVALVGCDVMTPSTPSPEPPTQEPEQPDELPPPPVGFPETKREVEVELYDDAQVHMLGAAQLETGLRTVQDGRLTFAEPVPYEPGDFIATGVSDKTPHGMLREVVSVQDGGMTVVTAPASVEDVVDQGTLRISGTLGPDDLTAQSRAELEASMGRRLQSAAGAGDDILGFRRALAVSYQGVTVSGSVEFKIGYELVARYDAGLKDLRAAITAAQSTVVSVSATASIMREWQLGRTLKFTPIVIPTPVIPLVFTPELEFYLGVEGGFNVEVSVQHDSVVKIGVECREGCSEAGNWNRFFERSGSPGDVSVGTEVAGYARVLLSPKLTFNLYELPLLGGLGGLFVQADPYLEAHATIDRCRDPHLSVHAGLEATVGGSAQIFGKELYDVSLPTYAVITPILLWDRWACLTATPRGENQIDLSWFEPPGYLSDPITGYRVEFMEDGESAWRHLADTTDTGYRHTDLTEDMTFHYRVRAITAKGPGWPSKPATASTGGALIPEMVVVPAGRFRMGAINDWSNDPDHDHWEYCVRGESTGDYCQEFPRHWVSVPSFAVGVHEVTYAQWDACVADGGCDGYRPGASWGRGDRPVTSVSWDDAQRYVAWLSAKTGEEYRLLSEAEWEYVARAGTTTRYHTGNTISTDQANFDGRYDLDGNDVEGGLYRGQTLPVGSFAPNAFGLYDVHGNVHEWVQDCWNRSYEGAPSDGSAWETGECGWRVVRGGSWYYSPRPLRSASRNDGYDTGDRYDYFLGFRVARTLKS